MRLAIIIVLWAASLFCAYRAGHFVSNRYDYSVPADVKSMIVTWPESSISTNDPLRNQRFRQFGKFALTRPQDTKQAGLFIGTAGGRPCFPAIFVFDQAKSGRPDSLMFWDAAGRSVVALDKNRDGIFDALYLFTTNGVYRDVGLTGKWQLRTNATE